MSTKFSPELFMAEFLDKLEKAFRTRVGFPYISVSKISLEICREKHYAMWRNRDDINRLVNEWYRVLPQGPSFTKSLFGHPVMMAGAMSASFVSIGAIVGWGLKNQDFIHFLPQDWA